MKSHTSSSYREDMLRMVSELQAQGVSRYTSAPPVYRLAWRLGFRVKPPLYQSFRTRAATMGVAFGILMAIAQWLLPLNDTPFLLGRTLLMTTVMGAIFGLTMSLILQLKIRRLRLPQLTSS